MRPRLLRLAMFLLVAVAPLLGTMFVATPPAAAGLAPATATFLRTWARTDEPVATLAVNRTWMWGPDANTGARTEAYVEAPGGARTVQYFDKSRMEDNSYRGAPPWDVTNGLLVMELVTGNMQVGDNSFVARGPAQVNVAGDADDPTGPTYATFNGLLGSQPYAPNGAVNRRVNRAGQTVVDGSLNAQGVTAAYYVDVPGIHHQIASPFWGFMNSSGLVYENGTHSNAALFQNPFYATGYPITEAYWANAKVGGVYKDVLMQCFERRCLTYTPGNPSGWQVEAGNVGQHYYTWRYGAQPPTPPAPPVASPLLWTATSPYLVMTTSSNWVTIPDMQVSITLPAAADLAISLSAMSGVAEPGGMFVRAVVDGQPASPGPLLFFVNPNIGTRSFTFVAPQVGAGAHTVALQWVAQHWPTGEAMTVSMADRTMVVQATPSDPHQGALAVRAAPSGPAVTTTAALWNWEPIPDMSTTITTGAHSTLAITLSGEAFTDGQRMFVRALVDGQPADPSGDWPVFAWGGDVGVHSATFTLQDVAAGTHTVVMQWVVTNLTTGSMGARTLVVAASPPAPGVYGGLAVSAKANDVANTMASDWVALPDMSASILTPADATLAITLTGDGWTSAAGSAAVARALVDGQPVDPPVCTLLFGDRRETRSFTFAAQHLAAGLHTVTIEWHTGGGATAYIEDRTLSVLGPPVP